MEVRGKVALVTGGGVRIGRALALYLAKEKGMRVAVHCRTSLKAAEGVAEEIRVFGGDACVFRADLSRRAESEGLVVRVSQWACDVVSVLVNNASVFERDEWDSVSETLWQQHMSVNLEAAYVLSRGLGEGLLLRGKAGADRKDSGKDSEGGKEGDSEGGKEGFSGENLGKGVEGVIVNMLDQRVLRLTPHYVSYSVSKFGLFGLTQILSMAMSPRVRVVGLGLGRVMASVGEGEEDFLRRVQSATRGGEAVGLGDVCGVLGMVLENDSLTGQTIALDGGEHLGVRSFPNF